MDTKRIRSESIRKASELGVAVSVSLPHLDTDLATRSLDDAIGRLLAMNVVAAAAYGFDRPKALAWLQAEGLTDLLTEPERRFLTERGGAAEPFQNQVEGMWALAWAIGLVDELNFAKDCEGRFAAMLPNLKQAEPSLGLRQRSKLRRPEEIAAACDLAYCLHWALTQARVDGRPLPIHLKPRLVIERRRALEWLLSTEEWDDISLDT